MSKRRFIFHTEPRFWLRPVCWVFVTAVCVLAGMGCAERGYNHFECAKCGKHCHTEWRGKKRTQMVVSESDLSQWLRQYDPALDSCTHDWIPVCGWSSHNNLCWDSFGTIQGRVLRQIKKLDSALDHDAIKEMLDRYYAIYAGSDDAEKGRLLEEFRQELAKRGATTR